MKIMFTPESIEDLKRLRGFIAEKSPNAANRIANSLMTGIHKLTTFPNLGIEVTKAKSDMIRDLILGDYIIRYLILKERIHILRIWHHKEDWS
ncbi:MAG: type II toxin-antitoxin system RelE/ParE family toxin [Spirochaetales bacterium]|nr:type II toxin-antitoxin system RelE/ParE family toxin [Spirochaetales bacterium]